MKGNTVLIIIISVVLLLLIGMCIHFYGEYKEVKGSCSDLPEQDCSFQKCMYDGYKSGDNKDKYMDCLFINQVEDCHKSYK